MQTVIKLLRDTFTEWNQDQAPRLAAALAYYTAFSLAPLLVVTIAIAGVIFSEQTARDEVLRQIQINAGSTTAELVSGLIESATKPGEGLISTFLGIATLLLGAIGAFRQLQGALDTIWDAEEAKPRTTNAILAFLKDNLLSFGMVLIIGFLLLVSLVISTMIAVFDGYLRAMLPGSDVVLTLLNMLISFGITTFLFALIYKFLPHVRIEWRDVLIGAAFTAFLFTVGRFLLGLYLANSSTASAYGAAGAFVLILLWIYYSAQIILFGAEFTQVYARYRREQIPQNALDAPAPITPKVIMNETPIPPDAEEKSGAVYESEKPAFSQLLFGGVTLLLGLVAGWLQSRSQNE